MKPDRLYRFFAVNYFAQGMGGIAYEPVSYYLKDALGLGPAESAVFVAWMTLPLAAKPLFGLLTDLLPWRGRRRGPHLLAVSLLTSLGWLSLAAMKSPGYAAALALLILVNVGFVLSDVVCDAVMVESGRVGGRTGEFQAVSIGTLYATLVVTGLGGGWLAQHAPYRAVFALAACFPLLVAVSARWVDEPDAGALGDAAARGWGALADAAREPKVWALAAVIFLWSFTPFLGTAQFYYQSETIGLSPLFIGGLSTVGGLAGIAGAAAFARVSKESERVARASIWLGAPLSLLYVFYRGPASILVLTALMSLAGVAFRLAWMDLAARISPERGEATVFAAYMAVFNIAASVSNTIGGRVYESVSAARGPYAAMVLLSLIGTAGTLAAWPFLRLALRDDAARA